MIRLMTLLVAATLLAAAPARAEKLDLSTITCKKFLEYNKDNMSVLLAWLDGYYTEEDDDAIIDFDRMTQRSKLLGEYCGKNPDSGVITATEKVWNKKK